MPRVEVAVERARQDLECRVLSRRIEVDEHRRSGEAAQHVVQRVPVRGQRQRRIDRHRETRAYCTVIVEDVEIALEAGDDDLDAAVAVDVVGGHGADHAIVGHRDFAARVGGRRVHGDRVGVGREAGQVLAAGAVDHVHRAVASAVDDVEYTVAVHVGERGSALARAGQLDRRVAQRRIAVHRDGAAVFAEIAEHVDRAQSQRDGVRVDVRSGDRHGRVEAALRRRFAGDPVRDHVAVDRVARARAVCDLGVGERLDATAILERPVEGVAGTHGAHAGAHGRRGLAHRVDDVEPVDAAREVDLGRDRRVGDEVEEIGRIRAAVAGELVPFGLGRVAARTEMEPERGRGEQRRDQVALDRGHEVGILGMVDVARRRAQQLPHFLRGERRTEAGIRREETAVDLVLRVRDQQRGETAGAPRRFRRAGRRRNRDPRLAAVIGAAVQDFEAVGVLVEQQPVAVGHRVHPDHVAIGGGVVVVATLLVGRARDDRNAAAVGVVDGGLAAHRRVHGAERFGNHVDAAVDRVDDRLHEGLVDRHERIADAQRQEERTRRETRRAAAVVGFGNLILGFAGAVAVVDVVEGIVVVLDEIPAGDVVDEAVAVVVDPVGVECDEFLAVAAVGVAGRGVVVGRDESVAVAVLLETARCDGQFAGVQPDLASDIVFAPTDAAVEHRHPHVRPARRALPRVHDVHARVGFVLPVGAVIVGQRSRRDEQVRREVGGVGAARCRAGREGHVGADADWRAEQQRDRADPEHAESRTKTAEPAPDPHRHLQLSTRKAAHDIRIRHLSVRQFGAFARRHPDDDSVTHGEWAATWPAAH